MKRQMQFRRRTRGFSLLETIAAGAIFIIGAVAVTSLVVQSSARRGRVSKGASFERLITSEYLRYAESPFDALAVTGGTTYAMTDPDGRRVTFTVRVSDDCNTPIAVPAPLVAEATSFSRAPPPPPPPGYPSYALPLGVQTCPPPQVPCLNGLCCKQVRLDAAWQDMSMGAPQNVNETYLAFVTKSCQ